MTILSCCSIVLVTVTPDWIVVGAFAFLLHIITYRLVCFCQIVCFLHQYILNYRSLVIFTVAILLNSRWRPDTMSVIIGTRFHGKLYITKYVCAGFRAFFIGVFWDMLDYRRQGRPFLNSRWRPAIMSIPISCESIYHGVCVCQFWFTCCKCVLRYARLYINGGHFWIRDGGRLPCRWRWVPGFILVCMHRTTSVRILVLLSQNAQSDENVILSRCTSGHLTFTSNHRHADRQTDKTDRQNSNNL